MADKEARRILLDIAAQMPSDVCADWIDAIGAGVQALEQEPCTDAISRQAAIDAVSIDNLHPGIVEALKSVLEDLPPVTPQECSMNKIKDYSHCLRCGKKLKNVEYRKRGYGEICWKKLKQDNHKKLFT